MRTKHFYLSLLLLVLGTANVWADKYYQPWDYRYEDPRYSDLSSMVGEMFMIYNTSFDGVTDLTGFIYDAGTTLGIDKTKERDRFIYNEKFVFILEVCEKDADGNPVSYAIKSITDGNYLAADGTTVHSTPQPIYIKDWDLSKTDGWSRSGVRSETRNFDGVDNASITTAKNQVFLVSSTATHSSDSEYWNGDATSFKTANNGQPFAFYKLREIDSGDYLTDLHVFSRSDLYSAQVIWGYVQTAADITVSPDGTDDAAANTSLLIDGDATTSVSTIDGTGEHYFQFYLGEGTLTDSLYIHLQRAEDNIPTSIKIQSCATVDGTYTDIDTYTTGLADNLTYTTKVLLTSGHKYIRVVNAAADTKISFSEIAILPCNTKTNNAMAYFTMVQGEQNPVYYRASWQQYTELVDEYNVKYPEAKTLSGVPLPGNKYRIYADTYDASAQAYVNKEISLDATTNDAVLITDAGSYNALKEAGSSTTAYEWYCEQTSDGYLVFRNVANTGLFLANNGVVSATAYKWSYSTVKTSRHGVPMWDKDGKYLAVTNAGAWQSDVTAAQDQTKEYTYTYTETTINDNGTADNESDDYEEEIEKTATVAEGVCTDFVFIPVDVTSNEKKITFTANEITKRNTVFTFDGVTYTLPFSKMFTSADELAKATLTLQNPEYHPYLATFVNNSDKADDEGKASEANGVVTFDYDEIDDCDILEIKLSINPFVPWTDGSKLYLIRSIRNQSIAQQAPGMRKADSDIEMGGDDEGGPIQTAGVNVYYAKFEGRDKKMSLIPAAADASPTLFDATSLFYFTKTEDKETEEYWSVNIRSAITTMKCANTNLWNEAGDTWYVQPNVAEDLAGYTIGLNVLDATNNPGDAWCTNHVDGDSIVSYYAEDGGAVWAFTEVDDAEAEQLLTDFITTKGAEVKAAIEAKRDQPGIDNDKVDKYLAYVQGIITNSGNDAITIAQLVDLSQKVHMLTHEIEYALQELPYFTDPGKIGENGNFDHPHWYYIYNVRSKYAADGTTEQDEYYAKYINPTTRMALDQVTDGDSDGKKDFGLEHMFYFEGRKVTETIGEGTYNLIADNALTVDEYLQVDVHNYAQPDSTLVSKNDVLFSKEDFYPGVGEQTIVSGLDLKYNETWRIECEYNFYGDKFESFNTYGTCLLSSTSPGLTWYNSEFQVYLQDDQEIVVKLNDGYDTHKSRHTVGKCSNIKIVITHSPTNTAFDIYNSDGVVWNVTYTMATLNTITKLTSMLPANGVKIDIIGVERIKAYNWRTQDTSAGDPATVDTKDEIDTWYILPSSNERYAGYSIVAKGANDRNLGWTNVTASNQEIFCDAGNADNSSWQFVQIKEFDEHVDQLLEKYNSSDCVIYNEKLAALFRVISKNASYIKKATYDNPIEINGVQKTDEDFFNEIYEAIKNYDGPMPDVLNKPKPGKFYTIRPAYGNSDVRVAVNDWNSMVQRDALIDNGEYDSHCVWFFDGDQDGDYLLRNDNLTLNSLHTQSNTSAFATDSVKLDDDDTVEKIVLSPVGGCIVRLNDNTGTTYLRHKAMGDTTLVGSNATMSYGYVSTTFERTGTDDASVTSTAFNEFNEVVASDDEANTPFSVAIESNYAFVSTGNSVTDAILCPNVNGNNNGPDGASIVDKPIELVLTYTNLPSSFTSFNNIGLHIHALNGGKNYQENNDRVSRQWNINVSVSTDGGTSYTDFGSATDIDIAAGIQGCNKVWDIVKTGGDFTIGGSLKVKLTISNGTTNSGCFFGLSNVILSAEGDTWYIEEMPDADKTKIFHKTKTTKHGLGSLMLGYTAKIPTGISAFYPSAGQDLTDRHITFKSYGEPSDNVRLLPACTPAILKLADASTFETEYKFYYDGSTVDDAADKADPDVDKIKIEGSLYKKYVHVADTYGTSSNVYMYLSNSEIAKMYWVWYNYTAEGANTGNNNQGKHINVNANRSYIVIDKSVAKNIGSLSLRFDGGWTTGIEDIEDDYRHEEAAAEGVEGIFDLQGRRLNEITEPGIYIVNGEKVLVK
ncbi:MAG: hypothetical protein IJZ22_08990 [Bacteroidaceae bacterium]|nr:hypothetical protein [Bacteroidaceae bacterium]